jgi:hypothetical protein
MMLAQGGYVTRDKDFGHRVIHVKTDLAKSLTDEQLAADLYEKNAVMIGFPVSTRPRKSADKADEKHELKLVAEVPEVAEVEEAPVVEPKPVVAPKKVEGAKSGNDKPLPPIADELRGVLAIRLDEVMKKLDESDALMITELARGLWASRSFFPKLSRKEFLKTFTEGGRYVED